MVSETVTSSVTAGLVSFLVALITTEYRLRRKQSVESQNEVQEWYAEAAQSASDIELIWENEYEVKRENGAAASFDEITRRMKMRGRQVNSHVGEAKSIDVDQELVEELEELSRLCSSLSDIPTGLGKNTEYRDRGREIADEAQTVEELALELMTD
mgnify:CR=1 FL=1